jgi:hypothetical protein
VGVPDLDLWLQLFAPITNMSLAKRMRGETHMRRMSLIRLAGDVIAQRQPDPGPIALRLGPEYWH